MTEFRVGDFVVIPEEGADDVYRIGEIIGCNARLYDLDGNKYGVYGKIGLRYAEGMKPPADRR